MAKVKRTSDRSTWSSPNPAEPVIVSRVGVYAPVSRLSSRGSRSNQTKRSWETKWGRIELSGPILTREHRRIILLSKFRAKETRVWEDGSLSLWIDAYEVKKELGYANGGEEHRRFMQRLRDMKAANLKIHDYRTKRTTESSVIWSFSYDREKPDESANPRVFVTDKGAVLFEIRLSKEYMDLFAFDLRVHFDPLIPDLIRLKDGIIESIVLFFLTQNTCQYRILDVLTTIQAILPGMSKGTVSDLLRKVKNNKDLERFQITVDEDSLVYVKYPKLIFTNPPGLPAGTNSEKIPDSEPNMKKSTTGGVHE